MTYTTKQRNEIYKKALKYLPETTNLGVSFSLCKAMSHATDLSMDDSMSLEEILLFKERDCQSYWLEFNDLQTRQIILDFCILMTEQ